MSKPTAPPAKRVSVRTSGPSASWMCSPPNPRAHTPRPSLVTVVAALTGIVSPA